MIEWFSRGDGMHVISFNTGKGHERKGIYMSWYDEPCAFHAHLFWCDMKQLAIEAPNPIVVSSWASWGWGYVTLCYREGIFFVQSTDEDVSGFGSIWGYAQCTVYCYNHGFVVFCTTLSLSSCIKYPLLSRVVFAKKEKKILGFVLTRKEDDCMPRVHGSMAP